MSFASGTRIVLMNSAKTPDESNHTGVLGLNSRLKTLSYKIGRLASTEMRFDILASSFSSHTSLNSSQCTSGSSDCHSDEQLMLKVSSVSRRLLRN